MSIDPSPVKPLLVVAALGLFIYGPDIMHCSMLISEMQETAIAFFFILPITLLLIVHFASELVVIPIMLVLVVFLLRGILVLLLIIRFLWKYYSVSGRPKERNRMVDDWLQDGSHGEEEGIGLGCFILMLLSLVLYTLFSDEGGYGWVSLILGMAFIFFFSML